MSQSVMQVNQERYAVETAKDPDTIATKLFNQEYVKAKNNGFEGTFSQYIYYRDYT